MTPTKISQDCLPISFGLDEYPWCCGIEVVTSVEEDSWEGTLTTLNKAVNHLCKKINIARRKTCLQMSIVTKYQGTKKGQLPDGFIDEMVRNKWKVLDVFKNSNTGNEVTVLSKVFPKKRAKKNGLFGSF